MTYDEARKRAEQIAPDARVDPLAALFGGWAVMAGALTTFAQVAEIDIEVRGLVVFFLLVGLSGILPYLHFNEQRRRFSRELFRIWDGAGRQ